MWDDAFGVRNLEGAADASGRMHLRGGIWEKASRTMHMGGGKRLGGCNPIEKTIHQNTYSVNTV